MRRHLATRQNRSGPRWAQEASSWSLSVTFGRLAGLLLRPLSVAIAPTLSLLARPRSANESLGSASCVLCDVAGVQQIYEVVSLITSKSGKGYSNRSTKGRERSRCGVGLENWLFKSDGPRAAEKTQKLKTDTLNNEVCWSGLTSGTKSKPQYRHNTAVKRTARIGFY